MNYEQILKYAKRLNPNNYEDLAHSYILYKYERGVDVVNGTFAKSYFWQGLKFLNWNQRNNHKYLRTRHGKDRTQTTITQIVHVPEEFCNTSVGNAGPDNCTLSMVRDYVAQRAAKTKAPNTYMQIFDLFPQGYKEREMAKMLGTAQQNLNRRKKVLQSWLEEWNTSTRPSMAVK